MLPLSRICLPCCLRMQIGRITLLNTNRRTQTRGFRIKRSTYYGDDPMDSEEGIHQKYDQLLFDAMDEEFSESEEKKLQPKPGRENRDVLKEGPRVAPNEHQTSRWDRFQSKFDYPEATHTAWELGDSLNGETTILHGFFTSRRSIRGVSFFTLIDFSGARPIQVVSSIKADSSEDAKSAHSLISYLKPYTPVAVEGTIVSKGHVPGERRIRLLSKEREKEEAGIRLGTPRREAPPPARITLEINVERIYEMNDVSPDIMITKSSVFGPKDRHLQLRIDSKLRSAMRTRARTAALCRSTLDEHGFLEIETPLLFKSTPEGAREFLVPTRQRGMMYALPQSPQQYKQILMASGVHRYYQLARCFRDEDLRADRQPEFTQLDLEMSFAKADDVMRIINELVRRIWRRAQHTALSIIPKLTYGMAMTSYGSDKPDLRYYHSRIKDITSILPYLKKNDPDMIVEGFVLQTIAKTDRYNADIAQKLLEDIISNPDLNVEEGGLPLILLAGEISHNAEHLHQDSDVNLVRRFLSADEGQIIAIQTRKKRPIGGNTRLGLVRDALLKNAYSQGCIVRNEEDAFVWITEFPLFQPASDSEPGQEGGSGLSSTHHPFTAPMIPDIQYLETDPLRVRAEHYDLVVNGVELGGGSARIHNAEMQRYILEEIIKVPPQRLKQFDHLLKVLNSGCPPHAGIALGFDRVISVLCGAESLRDVIAFPKNGKGADLLVNSPGVVKEDELKPYFLRY